MRALLVKRDDTREQLFYTDFLVGRSAATSYPVLVIPLDERVSNMHAVFATDGRDWYVVDLGSMNGTYVNGRRIYEQTLIQRGTKVRVGWSEIICVPC